eukprot:scaffold3091_cov349-Prasinococcus_capsulatus_cf.AAC.6
MIARERRDASRTVLRPPARAAQRGVRESGRGPRWPDARDRMGLRARAPSWPRGPFCPGRRLVRVFVGLAAKAASGRPSGARAHGAIRAARSYVRRLAFSLTLPQGPVAGRDRPNECAAEGRSPARPHRSRSRGRNTFPAAAAAAAASPPPAAAAAAALARHPSAQATVRRPLAHSVDLSVPRGPPLDSLGLWRRRGSPAAACCGGDASAAVQALLPIRRDSLEGVYVYPQRPVLWADVRLVGLVPVHTLSCANRSPRSVTQARSAPLTAVHATPLRCPTAPLGLSIPEWRAAALSSRLHSADSALL